jgi:hypothetical protein
MIRFTFLKASLYGLLLEFNSSANGKAPQAQQSSVASPCCQCTVNGGALLCHKYVLIGCHQNHKYFLCPKIL